MYKKEHFYFSLFLAFLSREKSADTQKNKSIKNVYVFYFG